MMVMILSLLLSIVLINIIISFANNENSSNETCNDAEDILTYINNKSKNNESISIIELESELVKRNIDILYENENKTTICHVAATNNYQNLIEYIVSKKDINIIEFINIKDKYGDTCIHKACFNNNIEIVKLLKNNKADIFINTNVGVNPLHSTAYKGHNDIIRLLIKEYNIPINIKTNSGAVPLHYAVGQDHKPTVLLLLELGANVNEFNKDGISALHIALKNNRIEIAKLLVSFGALIELKNNEGKMPLDYVQDDKIKSMILTEADAYLIRKKLTKK